MDDAWKDKRTHVNFFKCILFLNIRQKQLSKLFVNTVIFGDIFSELQKSFKNKNFRKLIA